MPGKVFNEAIITITYSVCEYGKPDAVEAKGLRASETSTAFWLELA